MSFQNDLKRSQVWFQGMFGCLEYLYITACYTTTTCQLYELHAYKRVVFSFHTRIITRVEKHYEKPEYSSVNGRFLVKTTEVRRVYVHPSLLVVTSNQNASITDLTIGFFQIQIPTVLNIYLGFLFSFFRISRCPFPYMWRHSSMTSKYVSRHISCMGCLMK
jgi:hypothetical protein